MTKTMDFIQAVMTKAPDGTCRDWPYATGSKGYAEMGSPAGTVRVGHLVMELGGRERPSATHQQLHSCDRPICIAPWHLRWGTNEENRAESVAKGRHSHGERTPNAKLTDAQVREIRDSTEGPRALAARLGVHEQTIYKVRQGKTWTHVKEQA